MNRAARQAKAICDIERRARARGEAPTPHARRLARLVCQGILSRAEAEDALAVILMGHRDAIAEPSVFLPVAAQWLKTEMAEERLQRFYVEQDLRRAVSEGFHIREPSARLLARAEAVNDAHGRPFVWPELRALVAEAVSRLMAEARRMNRAA